MPTYEYRCKKCGDHLEVFQSFSDAPLSRHNGGCGGRLVKVMSAAGIVLKGSGFYKNDSRDSARSKSKARSGKDGADKADKAESTTTSSGSTGSTTGDGSAKNDKASSSGSSDASGKKQEKRAGKSSAN